MSAFAAPAKAATVVAFAPAFVSRRPRAGFVLVRQDGADRRFYAGPTVTDGGDLVDVWTDDEGLAFPVADQNSADGLAAVVRRRMLDPAPVRAVPVTNA